MILATNNMTNINLDSKRNVNTEVKINIYQKDKIECKSLEI